jgi:tRNA (guanine37-N1)-methyltransferase
VSEHRSGANGDERSREEQVKPSEHRSEHGDGRSREEQLKPSAEQPRTGGAELRVDVVTIFPQYLAPLGQSLLGRAIERGQVRLSVHDLRSWTDDVHRTVDDTPYGGGPGMVMLPEPWGRALDALAPETGASQPRLIIPTPTGRRFSQRVAAELAEAPWLLFACGRYEGIDARVAEYAATRMPVEEISLGDYVLCGGEVAVLAIMEAVARLIPGVLGNEQSAKQDSFTDAVDGLLEAPAYTKPALWRGLAVPEVLLSGHHARIAQWRAEQSRQRSVERRPDLL